MEEETIEASPAPKKPYVRPQLHQLTGSEADGKTALASAESGRTFGRS
jgi:hypothetical protein